jgi:uncharacterized protein YndB with AHSA1/START domain
LTAWTTTSDIFDRNEGHVDTMSDNKDGSQQPVVIERIFDAPIDLVWRMWTDPEHFRAWYGPSGATIPVAKMDVRVGGTRFLCMEIASTNGPMQMWFTGEYRDVVENRRLVYTETMSDENGNVSTPPDRDQAETHPVTTEVQVELEDIGGRTRMVMTHVGIRADSPGAAGWEMSLDRLVSYVATRSDKPAN